MRHWLTPRCILVVLLLIVAPGAALAHLLVTWAPEQFDVARLKRNAARHARQLEAELEEGLRLQQQAARLQEMVAALEARSDWLNQRDQHGVFDRLAAALCDARVTIDRLSLGEPTVYAAASRTDLLACEQVTLSCTGDYGALTACLDRIGALDLPIRFRKVSWNRTGGRLTLSVQLQVPFVPDDELRELLADKVRLREEKHEP